MDTNLPVVHVRHKTFCSMLFAVCIMALFSNAVWAEKINLNSADAEALEYIPGIGPAKAERIIAERTASNGFKSVDDLLAVPGIGEKTLDVILQHAAINSGVSTLTEEMRGNPPTMSRNNNASAPKDETDPASTSG